MRHLEEEAKAPPAWGGGDEHEPAPAPRSGQPADPGEPLEDPAAYQAFVQSLLAKIEPKLRTGLDSEVQTEIANLTRLLTTMPRKVLAANRVYFELAFDLLAAEPANLLLVKSIRVQLAALNERSAPGIVRIVARICGSTPLNAAISGLLSIAAVAFLWFCIIVAGYVPVVQEFASDVLLSSASDDRSVPLLVLAIHASLFGSIVSILSRVQDYLLAPMLSPVLIYVSVISKPLLSVAVAVLAFAVMKAGVVSFIGVDFNGPAAPYLAWMLGFLAGFSERFAQDFVVSAIGTFGEPHALDLKSAQPPTTRGSPNDH